MKFTAAITIFLIFASAMFTGCVQRESRVADFCGVSYELARFNQIYDLDAEKNNAGPVDRYDGKAAVSAVQSYQDSFKVKQKVEVEHKVKTASHHSM